MKIRIIKFSVLFLCFFLFFSKANAKEGGTISLHIEELKGLQKRTIVNCMAVEDSNTVWLGTEKGLVKVVNGEIDTIYYNKQKGAKWGINAMVIDKNGTKWLGSNDGSIIILKEYLLNDKDSNIDEKIMASNDTHHILDVTTSVIEEYSQEWYNKRDVKIRTKDSIRVLQPLKNGIGMMHSMASVKNRVIMGTTKGYVMTIDIDSTNLSYPRILSESSINSVTLDDKGKSYLATSDKSLIDINLVEKYEDLSYLDRVFKIKPSKSNPESFWVIGKRKSSYKRYGRIYPYTLANIHKDVDNSIYSNSTCLLANYKGGRFTDFDVDDNNIAWIGTDKGLLMYDPENQYYSDISKELKAELKIESVRYLTIKHTGKMWLVSNDNRVFKINYVLGDKGIQNKKEWIKYRLIKKRQELSKAIHFTNNNKCKMMNNEKNRKKRRKRKKKKKDYETILKQLSRKFLSKRCPNCYEMTIRSSIPDSTTYSEKFEKLGGVKEYAQKKADRVLKRLKKKYKINEEQVKVKLVPTTSEIQPFWVKLEIACPKKKGDDNDQNTPSYLSSDEPLPQKATVK